MGNNEKQTIWELSVLHFKAWIEGQHRQGRFTEQEWEHAQWLYLLLPSLPGMTSAEVYKVMDTVDPGGRESPEAHTDEESWARVLGRMAPMRLARTFFQEWQIAHGWVTPEEIALHPMAREEQRRG